MSSYKKKYQDSTNILETVVVGIFKVLWFILKLPFKGLKKHVGLSIEDKNYIVGKRREISDLLGSESLLELRHAVMEADKLVDYMMKAQGRRGETFADRLRDSQQFLSPETYNEVWQGHKVRNQIAHESGNIPNSELRDAANKLLKYTRII